MTKLVLRLFDDQERPKSDPNGVKAMDTGLVEHYGDEETRETLGSESDLHVLKGNGIGKCCEGRYSHCGRYGHRAVKCRKKDIKISYKKGKQLRRITKIVSVKSAKRSKSKSGKTRD